MDSIHSQLEMFELIDVMILKAYQVLFLSLVMTHVYHHVLVTINYISEYQR